MDQDKKMCAKCNNVYDNNEQNFFKNKTFCKTCYNKMYRDKYNERKQKKMESKEIEIKNKAIKEYGTIVEAKKELEEQVKQLKIIINNSISYEKYNDVMKQCNEAIEQKKRCEIDLKNAIEVINKITKNNHENDITNKFIIDQFFNSLK